MRERLDLNNISPEKIMDNIRKLSESIVHLRLIVEFYRNRHDLSSLLLSDLDGILWQDMVILESQISFMPERKNDCGENVDKCPFHYSENSSPVSTLVKIDIQRIKKAIAHLEELIDSYKKRKDISPMLFGQLEWNLSEYNRMTV